MLRYFFRQRVCASLQTACTTKTQISPKFIEISFGRSATNNYTTEFVRRGPDRKRSRRLHVLAEVKFGADLDLEKQGRARRSHALIQLLFYLESFSLIACTMHFHCYVAQTFCIKSDRELRAYNNVCVGLLTMTSEEFGLSAVAGGWDTESDAWGSCWQSGQFLLKLKIRW